MQTVSDIRKRLSGASAEEYAVLERSLCADTRKGVQNALAVAKRRLAAEQAERERVSQLYSYQEQITNGALTVGLDEVGRGPLAGPTTRSRCLRPIGSLWLKRLRSALWHGLLSISNLPRLTNAA